jgi:integrase
MDAQMIFTAYGRDLASRRVSESALREYRIVTDRFTEWLAAEKLDLGEITRLHVQVFFDQTGWAASTQRARLPYLRSSIKYAIEDLEALQKDPTARVRLAEVPKREPRIISSPVLRQIKARIDNAEDWALFHAFAYTGMRLMEVAGLTWNGVSRGEQTLNFVGKGNKERTIPLHPALQEALGELPTFRMSSIYVFPGRAGGMVSRTGMWRKLGRVTEGFDVQALDFRRTVASSLENNEAREAAIYAIMGWSPDSSVRLRAYTLISQRRLYLEMLKLYADDPI